MEDSVKASKSVEEADAVVETRAKALGTSIRNVLESKIHQSFTVAADELFGRGYLTREQRIALSGLIGQTLGDFGGASDLVGGATFVMAEDVSAVAAKEETAKTAKELAEKAWGDASLYNWRARRGQTIRGRLVRGIGGKFAGAPGESLGRAGRQRGRVRRTSPTGGSESTVTENVAGRPPRTADEIYREAIERAWAAFNERAAKVTQVRGSSGTGSGSEGKKNARERILARIGFKQDLIDALGLFADGEDIDPALARQLERLGIIDRPEYDIFPMMEGQEGQDKMQPPPSEEYRFTTYGRRLMGYAEKGDLRGARDMLSLAREKVYNDYVKAMEKRQKVWERYQDLLEEIERLQRQLERYGYKESFSVFKDWTGSYRWITVSSNAYRDRDKEIVSTKALQEDCARLDKTKEYGPLRFWHVGMPDSSLKSAPWGKGLDIGVCDFNMMVGKLLVESGTFHEAWVAERIKEVAPSLQVSIGFHHSPSEPDHEGVYHTIRRFERSLLPRGKAANPWTSLTVQETPILPEASVSSVV